MAIELSFRRYVKNMDRSIAMLELEVAGVETDDEIPVSSDIDTEVLEDNEEPS